MNHPFNLKSPLHILATGFLSGLIKPAPGTWGTLAGALIYYFALSQLSLNAFYLVLLISIFAGVYICGKTAKDCGTHDHGSIVWDEFAGLWLTLALITLYLGGHVHLYWQIGAFLLFRFFDILKPFPIGLIDKRLHGGLGIMVDDLLAALYAAAVLWGIIASYGYFVVQLS